MNRSKNPIAALLIVLIAGCTGSPDAAEKSLAVAEATPNMGTLAAFPVGVAVPADPWPASLLQSSERQRLVNRYFNSLTAENIMKMAYLQPAPGEFSFKHADALVEYARQRDMHMHGHALVWHRQAPGWMNEFEGSRSDFEEILTQHVRTLAEHFAGRVQSWDVVNEAFEDKVPTEYRKTIWYDNIGHEYIELAFRTARSAAPEALLYYNDYDISGILGPVKLDRILNMVDDFLDRGVPIDGIGFQMHIETGRPSLEDIRNSFSKAAARGIKIRISELDVSVNVDRKFDQFSAELAELQRQRYFDVVRIYKEAVPPQLRGGITVWGITDGDSWIPGFKNRPDWPLLFDAEFQPKPALQGMIEGLKSNPE